MLASRRDTTLTAMVQTQPLAWGARVIPEFRARVFLLCDHLGWSEAQASELMAVMAFETGRTFSAKVRNPHSSACGLLQFMAATAKGMGTTTTKLAAMTDVAQLDYVERYLLPMARRIASLEDLYMAVLWPAAIGKPLDTVLWSAGTPSFAVNRGLDANHNGQVTKREAAAKVREQLAVGLLPANCTPAPEKKSRKTPP
jgi:hypothetical protein